jgi:hypothetical protein
VVKITEINAKTSDKLWKIHLFKEASIRDIYQRRMTECSKDCPPNDNIKEECKLISEILNKKANECLGTKN